MESRKKGLTNERIAAENAIICRMLADPANSHERIMREVRCGHERFKKVCQYYEETGKVLDPNIGRPKEFGDLEKDHVECATIGNPDLSLRRFAAKSFELVGKHMGRSTIALFRKSLHFRFLPKIARQVLTAVHVQHRMPFSRDLKAGLLNFAFLTMMLLFSDESRFCMGNDSRWVWRRPGEDVDGIYHDTVKFPVSIMVWGAIGHGFKSKLEFIEGTLDSKGYVAMLIGNGFIQQCNELFGLHGWCFMQDGAPCHTARSTLEALLPLLTLLLYWPANSPDLNPIEMIWAVMKRRLNDVQATTKEEFKAVVQEVWDKLDIEKVINPLVDSFERRIDVMQRLGGQSIQRHLHQSMARIGINAYGPVAKPPELVTDEQDDLMMTQQAISPYQWAKIGRELGIDRLIVKGRVTMILERRKEIKKWEGAVAETTRAEEALGEEGLALLPNLPPGDSEVPAADQLDVVNGPVGPIPRMPAQKGKPRPKRQPRDPREVIIDPPKVVAPPPPDDGIPRYLFNGERLTATEVRARLEMVISGHK
jgi:hypothetical protein